MRKRMTSLLLTLVMLLSLVPAMGVTASAEETWETVNSYAELQTAVKAKKEYIKLGRDIDTKDFHYSGGGLDIADWLTFENQTCTLDLNGKTLSLLTRMGDMPTFMRVYEGSNLTIKDSQGGGQITGEFENANAGDRYLIHMNQSSLTLEGGTFRATAKPYGTNVNVIDYLESNVTIKDGVTISQPEHYAYGGGGSALKGRGYALCEQEREFNYGDKVSHVVIDGGIFDGWVRLIGYPDTNGSVQINGGTFKKGVQALYVAKKNNSDPTVTVNGGTFEDNVYLQDWDWKESLYMPYRLNGGTFKGTVDLHAVNNITVYQKPESNPNVALGLNECFGYSAVVTPDGTFAGPDAKTGVLKKTGDYDYDMWLEGTASNPVRIIPNAWGMKSVKLDGTEIDYAKDFKGEVKEITNDTEHTLTFTWKPLADELRGAGYSYDAKCERYVPGATSTPTNFILDGTEYYTYTFLKGADPTLYSFDLHLNLKKGTSNVGIVSNEHIVRLLVSEAPPAPPAPVAHSIKIVNTFGTATPSTAMAGETITVKAKDRTAENMMFTQWYAKTAGVTFKDATKQETTFVMPDCDVEVNPGFQQVSFTKQPTDSWLSSVDDSKVYFAFSQPITSWKLVNEDDTTLASGDAESANALVAATLGPKPDKTEMTCRVIVTSNGQNFTSNEFTLKWYNVPGAPDVTVYPEGGKFVETLDVNLKTPNTYWGILYTTDGSDPYDKSGETWTKNPKAIEENDSTRVTINKDTTIKACLYNSEGYSNMEKFGDIVTCDFTKVGLTPPVADPVSGTSFYDRLNVSLSTDIVNAKIMWSYDDLDVDDLGNPGKWKEYEPEKESITLSGSYGMHGFYALTGIQMEHPDGYTYWVHSDKQDYSYPRITYATIADASVTGKVNEEINPVDVSITLSGDVFAEDLTAGTDVSSWFTNRPDGLKATVKEKTNYTKTLVITISGTPTATSAAAISVEMPKSALRYTGTGTAIELTVLSNSNAVYNIGTDAAHTHDYTGQPYLYLDPGNHYQECKAGDGYNIQAHDFSAWTKVDDTNHSRTCSKCKKSGETANYTETANHNWQWVVDTAATPNAAGKQHEECVDCHAKRSENTEIPMLTSIMVEHLTVAKPVKDAAAAMATTTDSSYTVANTEWMAADGTPLAIGGKFQPGTVYTVKITLETAGAGVFSVKSTYNTIEGKTATVSPNLTGDNHADSVILTYTFDATEGTYVPTKPAITTVALPDGKVGDAYSQTLAATGTNPITWGIEAGTLPDGLTLVGDTIKGTPSKAGDFKFTVKATNGGGSDTKELTIKVADAEAAKYHNVTLSGAGTGATGAGSHAAGTTVNIYAGTKSGYTFNGWTSDDVTVLSASSKNASFVMPNKDVTVKANWIYNGGGSSGGGYTYYTIKATAGVNGSISPTGNVSVREGRDQTFTITPNKGYAVAKVLIDSKNVGAVKSYTFENVKKNHTIEVVFMKASGNPQTGVFVDVPEGSYYEEAVNWAVEKGITTGTDAAHFSPDGICTRAQAVTFLWRAAGSPAAKSAVMPFADVKAGSYYYDAVLWAVENGITKGTSDTMFSPDATCSRAQIVTFLWRSQKSPAAGTANPFTDVKASAYYADAVLWAVKEDVTKGTTNTTFSPDANCTRAQIVTFIWRALAE